MIDAPYILSARRSCQAEKIIVEILSVVVLVESADIACGIQVRNMLFLMLRKMFHTLRRIPARLLKPIRSIQRNVLEK